MNDVNLMSTGRRVLRILGALFVVILMSSAFLIGTQDRAAAASDGPWITYPDIGHIGSYRLADGSLAYCVEIGANDPYGPQTPPATVDVLPAYDLGHQTHPVLGFSGVISAPALHDPAIMRQINYAINEWGVTSDDARAAATQLAVFILRGGPTTYIDSVLTGIENRGGGSVVSLAHHIVNDARQNAVPAKKGSAPDGPVLELADDGTSAVLSYDQGTTSVTLKNGIFAENGSQVLQVNPTSAGSLDIVPVRPDGWDKSFELVASTTWKVGTEGWRDELVLHEAAVPFQQRTASAVGATVGTVENGVSSVRATHSNSWWPILSTQVEHEILDIGDEMVDMVNVQADPEGGEWTKNAVGRYLPLTLEGTLYGPLAQDPTLTPLDEAPEDAPIVTTVKILADQGPGEYQAASGETAVQPGFYTWVWRIDWDTQDPEVVLPSRTGEPALVQSKFPIQDRFGEVTETHAVPQHLHLSTQLDDNEVGLGWSIIDQIDVVAPTNTDLKPSDAFPVTLRGTLYHSDQYPEQAAVAPESAVTLGEVTAVIRGDSQTTSEPIPLPIDLQGFVTMQWCVLTDDQPIEHRALTVSWCDDYGVPEETAEILSPTVRTQAQPAATPEQVIHDTAFVEGLVPNESSVDFTAYLKPVAGEQKYDSEWERIEGDHAVWTSEEIDELGEDWCTAQPVAMTDRVNVEQAGTYRSPGVKARSTGTVYWVERLYGTDPVTGDEHLIHEGECGLPNETTVVYPHAEARAAALAATGAPQQTASVLLAGVGLIGAGAMGLFMRSQRRKSVD